ncbi:MAG: hypothetical protein CBC35_08975 [Planctomycetes bacterium TMED75]|nr:polyisoprenoid-binding protein [Planctomycetaceae bacterium]OUU91704.1 MAG: hypothetical protein CBC35_08975 [Planctomycetes bacterium TMED75]
MSSRSLRTSLVTFTAGIVLLGGALAATSLDTAQTQETPAKETTAESWKVDTVHSCALFRVRHMGAGFFWGRFNDVTGAISFDPAKPEALGMDISIDVDSVDSGHPGLDKHLKSPDFFDSKEFPAMSFKSESVVMKPTTKRADSPVHAWDVSGKLSIRGTTKEVTAELLYWGAADLGRGNRAGFEATFDITRSDFDINYGIDQGALGNVVNVTAAFEVTK